MNIQYAMNRNTASYKVVRWFENHLFYLRLPCIQRGFYAFYALGTALAYWGLADAERVIVDYPVSRIVWAFGCVSCIVAALKYWKPLAWIWSFFAVLSCFAWRMFELTYFNHHRELDQYDGRTSFAIAMTAWLFCMVGTTGIWLLVLRPHTKPGEPRGYDAL